MAIGATTVKLSGSLGMAAISFDLSSAFTCTSTNPLRTVQALTMWMAAFDALLQQPSDKSELTLVPRKGGAAAPGRPP